MLQLKNISKKYVAGDLEFKALENVSLNFRKSEFVSILGVSGSGKTTLLNIIGGLDRYDEGDLSINGKSTTHFTDADWDNYRNHSIGFVFQSYNLIPHQTVLANVELALTISGVSKHERRKRAIEALEQVGLGDQLKKKPNQLSGGQMQRVAIARALVNNPDIVLADEPTGALDSETSVQIMEILKSIAKDRLIIMVTHNPDLATQYSTRIIRLKDGHVTDDSNPYSDAEAAPQEHTAPQTRKKKRNKQEKNPSMSFATAFSLSLKNLMTKKGRTILTAFAGSIGIIGIALILSLSNGMTEYINQVQEETLTSYPITIESQTVDMTDMMVSMMNSMNNENQELSEDKIYSSDIMTDMIKSMATQVRNNDLKSFKEFLESGQTNITDYINSIQYGYDAELYVYRADTENGIKQVNPDTVFEDIGMGSASSMMSSSMMSVDLWEELLDNERLLESQYEILSGTWPKAYNEVVLMVDRDNRISDYTLYALGIKDTSELKSILQQLMNGQEVDVSETQTTEYDYEELMNIPLKLVLSSDFYQKNNNLWTDMSDDETYMKNLIAEGIDIKIVGIVKPSSDNTSGLGGTIGYTKALTEYVIEAVNQSEIAAEQKQNPEIDIFTGLPFETDENTQKVDIEMLTDSDKAFLSAVSEPMQAFLMNLTYEEFSFFASQSQQIIASGAEGQATLIAQYQASVGNAEDATYEGNLRKIGVADLENPSSINIYPKDFESKDSITALIEQYNTDKTNEGHEELAIAYTDYIGLLLSSVTTIINAISYVLIAFVAISLVVSSIMIGIITYISVLERTKEIGVLRSIGASKRDVARVFNAETLIIGFVAGMMGILVTLILLIPGNLIIEALTGIGGLAVMPWVGAVILVAISMFLTWIAGLIPARVAAKKDPVVALRTE